MVVCKTNKGIEFTIDDDMLDFVNSLHWYMSPSGYIYTHYKQKQHIRLQRHVVGAKDGEQVDHIDGNKTNNTRSNLRICTCQQNKFNIGSLPNTSSKYKGVNYDKNAKKWRAFIRINGKKQSLGYFSTEEEAAKAYDNIAKTYHGEFARLNLAISALEYCKAAGKDDLK